MLAGGPTGRRRTAMVTAATPLLGDVAGLAAVAEGAHEQRVVDALVEHGRGVRPADCRHGGQRGDRATLDRSTDRRRVGVDDRAAWVRWWWWWWWWSCRPASRIGPGVSMAVRPPSCADRPRRLADALDCAGSMVSWLADTVTVPAVTAALRHITITGVFYCPSYLREPWGGTMPADAGLRLVPCRHLGPLRAGRRTAIVCELQAGDLALVPHGAGHRIEAGGPSRVPVDPRPPPRGAVGQLRRPALRRRRPAHRARLRRTAPRAPQRPPAPRRPPARRPRPHRPPHRARRHARSAGRGGTTAARSGARR